MTKKKSLLAAALTLLLVSLACVLLYRFDNKYTRTTVQPINGVLFYEEPKLTYLTRQWVCWPDVLLTPEEAAGYDGYRAYADIGGQTVPGTGSVTYGLTLMLPQTPRAYALELPEVFSACTLYVDGVPLLQLGDPNPSTYAAALSSRVVSFRAYGRTDLLLAVTDQSGVGKGLIYPPAFGLAAQVYALREARLLLHGGLALLALLGIMTAVVFLLRRNRLRGVLTCLLCACLTVMVGYPVYHGLFVTAVQPWYTLEPLCHYTALFLALWLYGLLYGVERKPLSLLLLPSCVGIAAAVLRYGAASVLPPIAATVFSILSELLKLYAAVCLLGLSVWAVGKDRDHSVLLLCGAAALAVCLLWDRLLPLHEPMVGCWFGELGGLLLGIVLTSAVWLDASEAYRFRLTYEESYQQMQQRLAMQKEHYNQLSQQVRLAREANHDLRHHMRAMRSMADQQQWDRLSSYLKDYESHLWEREVHVWSDHPVADAVLAYYATDARNLGASYDVRFAVPPELAFPDDELCIILSNLLENAVDALAEQQEGHRRLYLRGQVVDGQLGIVVDNTFLGELHQRDGLFLSTKHPGHGLGIGSVTTVAKKHGGLVDFNFDGRVFHASVLIPLSPKETAMVE